MAEYDGGCTGMQKRILNSVCTSWQVFVSGVVHLCALHTHILYIYTHTVIFICIYYIHVVKQPASIVAPLSSIRCFRVGKPDRSRQWILQRRGSPMVGWLFEKMSGSQSEWISMIDDVCTILIYVYIIIYNLDSVWFATWCTMLKLCKHNIVG